MTLEEESCKQKFLKRFEIVKKCAYTTKKDIEEDKNSNNIEEMEIKTIKCENEALVESDFCYKRIF